MIELFWSPPKGEKVLGITLYEDLLVIATDFGIYVMSKDNKVLDDYIIRRINIPDHLRGT